jgi:hypothetical protein
VAFASIDDFRTYFGSGPLTDAAERAFNPGAGSPGASVVYGVRAVLAGSAAQGSVTYAASVTAGASSPTATALTFKTVDFGAYTTQMRLKVEAASNPAAAGTAGKTAAAVKVTVQSGTQIAVTDNVGYNGLWIQYVGASATTSVNLTPGGVLTLSSSTGGETLTYTLTTTTTIQNVIDFITANSTVWQAAFPGLATIGGVTTFAGGTNANFPGASITPATLANVLDATTTTAAGATQGPVTVTANTPLLLTAINQAIADLSNSASFPFFSVARTTLLTVPVPNTSGFLYATGGADGTLTSAAHYQTAMDVLKTVDTGVVCVAVPSGTTDSMLQTLHYMLDGHCQYMSGGGATPQRERIQVFGPNLGKDLPTAIAWANYVNSGRSAMIWPGVIDQDRNGNTVTYPPYITAAQIGGMLCGNLANVALTRKYIKALGLEVLPTWTTPTNNQTTKLLPADIDAAVQAGIMVVAYVPGKGYRIVQSLTTWTQDTSYLNRELSVRRCADWIVRDVRDTLDGRFIGQTNSPGLVARVVDTVTMILRGYAERGWLIGDATNPPYRNIQANVPQGQPDTMQVSFEASIGIPANFILLTAHTTSWSGSLTGQ